MQYGYFNDAAREYVITDPRTPTAWANYLGSPEYGAIVTQNAGGYSFVKSGAHGRILRYSFNQFAWSFSPRGSPFSFTTRPAKRIRSAIRNACNHRRTQKTHATQ